MSGESDNLEPIAKESSYDKNTLHLQDFDSPTIASYYSYHS